MAAKSTLEILAAPVEVKFATSFTSFFGDTFCFQVIPKQVSSPTHFSLCGRRHPQCFPKGCPGMPRLSPQGRKMKIQAAQVGLGTKPFLWRCRVVHPKMKAQRLWWGHLDHHSGWGNRLSPFPQAEENPVPLLVSMVVWLSFCSHPASLEICLSFAKEEPEPKRREEVRIWRAVVRHINDLSWSKLPLWDMNCCTKLKVWILCKLFILFAAFVILCILSH